MVFVVIRPPFRVSRVGEVGFFLLVVKNQRQALFLTFFMRHLGSVSNQKSVTLRLLPLEVEIQLFGARKWDLRAILGLKYLTK